MTQCKLAYATVFCGIIVLTGCPTEDNNTTSKEDMAMADQSTDMMLDLLEDMPGRDMTSDMRTVDQPVDMPDLLDMAPDQPTEDMTDMTSDPCEAVTCEHNGACVNGQCVCPTGWRGDRCQTSCDLIWGQPSMPVTTFNFGAGLPDVLWNDPTILKTNNTWTMWLTGGITPQSKTDKKVRVYRATSNDGLSWQLNTSPLIEPGAQGAWDDKAIETPSVIVDAQGIYHLYYSGASFNDGPGVYAIGHATSTDGITWTKDPNNPILTTATNSDWGVFTVAEPAAVFNPKTQQIHLYYVSAGGSADVTGQFAILLATSQDGSTFTHHTDEQNNRQPVWSLTTSYAPDMRYRGFSTPAIAIGPGGRFHLTHDVVQAPMGDPNGFDQVALGYATSDDGVHFKEENANLVIRGARRWFEREIRAPYLVFDGQTVRMWFAGGQNLIPAGPPDFIDWPQHIESFGYIEGTYMCP